MATDPQGYPVQQYKNLANDIVFEVLSDGTLVFNNGSVIASGNGSPNGHVEAPKGSLYMQKDGVAPDLWWQKQTGTGNTGWVLSTGPGGTPPGGADTQVQFNNAGAFDGDPAVTWDGTSLTVHDLVMSQDNLDNGANDLDISANGCAISMHAASAQFVDSDGNGMVMDTAGDKVTVQTGSGDNFQMQTGTTTFSTIVSMLKAIYTQAAATVGAGKVSFGATHATTVGAAGGASALPATPSGYLIINVEGTAFKIPYYAN